MAFFRRWLLILSALVLGGGALGAAGTREDRAYAAALAEFHDGLYDQAAMNLAQFAAKYPKSTNVAAAMLFRAQAQYQLGRFPGAVTLLTDTNNLAKAKTAGLLDQYAYWKGEAQFASGDFSAAADTWLALAQDFPNSPLGLSAVVEAASAYGHAGLWPRVDALLQATNGIFARESRLDSGSRQVLQGSLLLAQSKNEQRDFGAGQAILKTINTQLLDPEQQWLWASLLHRNRAGADDLAGILTAATNLVQFARAEQNLDRLATAHAALAAALAQQNQLAAAVGVWSDNLGAGLSAARQREAIMKIAALSLTQGNISNAVALLEQYLKQYADAPAADLAWLTLGELHLKQFVSRLTATNELVAAQSAFDHLLANPTSPLAAKAFLDRGWCHWLAGSMTNSLADFRAAAARFPHSDDLAVARFKTGDALLALDDFAAAREQYLSVLNDFTDLPTVAQALGDRALYQIMRADLKLGQVAGPGAEETMRQLLEKFPNSELQDKSLLLTGEGFSDFGLPDQARAVFRQFAQQFPGSPLESEVQFAVARTYEREGNWPAAITNYLSWLNDFPTDKLRPQVKFALAEAEFHAGNESGAFQLFTAFIPEFPTDKLAPLAQWWVADHFFRTTNAAGVIDYGMAETNYENIFQTPAWKNSPLVYPAQLMAGRAAMARLGFPDAATYFSNLLSDAKCPAGLAVQARFAYGHALMQSEVTDTNRLAANYQSALALFGQVCQQYPTNETGALAWSEIGDASLQLNDFDAATNAYAQVLSLPAASIGLRSRAQVGLGLVLEKQAALLPPTDRNPLLKLALDNYRTVLYTPHDQADPFWIKKAGLQALPLMVLLKDGDVDKFFDRLEYWLPQLKLSLEKKRAAVAAEKD